MSYPWPSKQTIGDHTIEIGYGCLESYPCQHYVTVDGKGKNMYGVEIYRLLTKLGAPVPEHFILYSELAKTKK
jgi:hypothetical protein